MGLVDYSSGSESEPSTSAAKRRKTSHSTGIGPAKTQPPPPLPAAFHDLYASTVRVSTVDDPSLHQGRKRVNPHKAGNWPSHIYIDVQPSQSERAILSRLLASITSNLSCNSSEDVFPIHSFLSSDLGAEQPLHISLSRPLSLETSQKTDFLDQAREAVNTSGIAPFKLCVLGVYWHRTRESARSFLVLKVASSVKHPTRDGSQERDKQDGASLKTTTTNPELQALLAKTNKLATSFGQPSLYAAAQIKGDKDVSNDKVITDQSKQLASESPKASEDVDSPVAEPATSYATARPSPRARDAFHISIAWSPAEPTAAVRKATADVARTLFAAASTMPPTTQNNNETGALRGMQIPIDVVKVKIGNVITSIALHSGMS